MLDKRATDVMGSQMNCPNFAQCPFCYGCRNYEESNPVCELCGSSYKKNVCNTQKHNGEVIAKMIQRNKINL